MIGPANVVGMFDQALSLWPAAVTLAMVAIRDRRAEGARRERLNELLHELRRPLQILALAERKRNARLDPLELALHALRDLDREINGAPAAARRARAIDARKLVDDAASRWRVRAARSARPLRVRWLCEPAVVAGDRHALSQALDNLISNSLVHGSGPITLVATLLDGAVQIAVRDAGASVARQRAADRDPRHGHGLRVTGRVAARHGGSFELRRSRLGTVAALRLPLAGGHTTST